ncbi:protein Shroom3 isoform 1-T1 [Synchiropus picturatus]
MESRGGRAGLQQQRAAGGGGSGWVLVEARLQGGAPWGFTLQGGLEHGEPLIISKVEEGGKADRLECPLLVGDEIIIINEIELTGFRQEAIALVKGSYKTLQITVRREFYPGYIDVFRTSPPSFTSLPPPSPLSSPSPSPVPHQIQTPQSYNNKSSCPTGGVQMRIKNKNREPASRPHSWHSTKLGDGQPEADDRGMEPMSGAWQHSYHTSASTTDLSGGFESGSSSLRKSPDQYSSRGSMESLDPPHSSHHHHTAAQHPGHHTGGTFPTYSSCQHLSSARSSNSIDHLHNKRDSAYSSFSTSSSIPDYLASTPSFSPERSFSLETVPQRGGEMQHADLRYIQTVYDAQQGFSQDPQLTSTSLLSDSEAIAARGDRDMQGSTSGVCYRGGSSGSSGVTALNRHSAGPIWGPVSSHSSSENLRWAPAPPRRSDSYKAIRNHERPNSWSSLENARSLRSLQKGTWHHSIGPVASGTAKGSYGTECQLHTVIEKSPESSPTTKPRQGGGFPQPSSPPGSSPGPTAPAPQSGWPILPTVVYPVPQPEPHFAQMPSSSPSSSSRGMYPALVRDEGLPQQSMGEQLRKENGYQIYSSSSQLSSFSEPEPTRLRAQKHEADSSYPGVMRSDARRSEGRFEGEAGVQRLQSHSTDSRRPQHSSYDQDYHNHQAQLDPRSKTSQEWREPYGPVHSRRERNSSMEQPSVNQEPLTSPRVAQGQAPPTQFPFPHQLSSVAHSRHHGDLTDVQQQHLDQRDQDRDRDHPLTRLELALAEVQRCSSPHSVASAGSHGNANTGEGSHGPARSLSVLEKVSRFERQERAGKQRSHSTRHGHTKSMLRLSESGRSTPCGADDLRNMLERSNNGNKAQRTLSCRGGSNDYMKYRTPSDPNAALQRSRSTFHLEESREGGSSKDFPWRQDVKEVLGSVQDTTDNRHYRDSLKDAQSRVLRSTSFQRRDLTSTSIHPSSSSNSHQKQHSFEKKGPKTMPKPVGVIITPQTSPPITSPHVPKERHVVGPEVRGVSPPALPSVPPVGPPSTLMRIGGRKRLTADQKKRSYSEPENINEIGVSDAETVALFKRGGETSVADRRKMFEAGVSQNTMSKPDLRQLQHSALADYVERKRGVRRDEGPQRSGPRPRSAYLQSEGSNAETLSLSSASSLLSLQDSDHGLSIVEQHHGFSRPPAADLRSLQSNYFYPGRVTSPRLPANPTQSSPEPRVQGTVPDPDHQLLTSGVSRHLNGALQRAGSTLNAGKSASAEDLLERPEKQASPPQHSRSRSSPIVERLGQESPPEREEAADCSEIGRHSLAEERGLQIQVVKKPEDTQQEGSLRSTTPVTHRERRQRNGERPRSHSTSALAASVGLPCPLTPHSAQDPAENLHRNIEQLHQANLDDISFPQILQSRKGDADDGSGKFAVGETCKGETQLLTKQTRHSLSEADVTDTKKESYRGRTFSLGMRGEQFVEQVVEPLACLTSQKNSHSPPPSPHQRLSSLRISESNLLNPSAVQAGSSTTISQEDFDEVFLQNPAAPSPTPALDDFPPPPPPVYLLEKESSQENALSSEPVRRPSVDSPPVSPFPSAPALPPSQKSHPSSSVAGVTPYLSNPDTPEAKQNLGIEYHLPPKREKTPEEMRVESLAQQLVLQERSLAPLLDTCGGKSTVELVEEIFVNSKSGGKASWQRRGSKRLDHRFHDLLAPAQPAAATVGTEIDWDERDVNSLKLELCEALKSSVVALKQEKDAVREEQKHHQSLGANVDSLVQKLCKSNEKEKYHMFIGDLDTVVNLLLSLCGRLSRIDRSLLALQGEEAAQEDAAEERESLYHKRSLLLRQTEDAWELKENLDRRQRVVHDILSGYLTDPQLQDYRGYVSTKPSLLIRQRHLDDLIRQAEERLVRLAESLSPEQAAAHGWARGCGPPSQSGSTFPPSLTSTPAHSARSTTVTSL